MGYCADPTPEMDGFSIETRSESFYLRGRMWAAHLAYGHTDPHAEDYQQGTVEFSYEDIPKIRAALDQAERLRR